MAANGTDDENQATLTADNPIVPSAPSDQPPPVTFERPPTRADIEPQPPTPKSYPATGQRIFPVSPSNTADRQQQVYQDKLARWNAQQMYEGQQSQLREINRQTGQTFKEQGVATERNPETGMVEPARDESGNLVYHPGKGPVQYDETGKPFQVQRSTAGPKAVQLDTDAPIDVHPDRPNELYKQNKYSPWEYLGTVQEGLQSSDKDIQSAAQDAQLKLDKRLHAAVGNDLGQVTAARALDVQNKAADFKTNSDRLRDLSNQLDAFDQDHPGATDTTGHWFTGGAHATPQAQALQDQKAAIQKEVDDLSSKGYSALDPEKQAGDYDKAIKAFTVNERKILSEHGRDLKSWRETSPKEFGDLDSMLQERQASLVAAGRDPSDDPIFQSLEKRKAELGIGQAGQPAQESQDRQYRQDPLFAPLMQERDQLDADHKAASDQLDQLSNEYTKRISGIEQDLNNHQNQIAPLRSEVDALNNRLSQIDTSSPSGTARAQTILDRLNPMAEELRQREAAIAPVQEAHAALLDEFEKIWQSSHDQFESQLAPRREDLQNRFQQAQQVNDLRATKALNFIDQNLLAPTHPDFAQTITNAKTQDSQNQPEKVWDFEPNSFERELFSAPAQMLGEGLKGFADLSEAFYHLFPNQQQYNAVGTRWLADQILKVPGVLSTPDSQKSLAGKTGGFLGGVGGAVGESLIDPAILIPQFFGQGMNGQVEAAQKYFNDQDAKNPDVPRDVAHEHALTVRAGVLGGLFNALFAVPFEGFGGALKEAFGSTGRGPIADALKKAYDTGGTGLVATLLNGLRDAMARRGAEGFQKVAVDAMQPIIDEITKTGLQRTGIVAAKSAENAVWWGGIQAAQNAVTKTYNPDQGLFENVLPAAGQGAVLGAFFSGMQQYAREQRAEQARTEIASGAAKPTFGREAEPLGPERGLQTGEEPPSPPAAPNIAEVHNEIDNLNMEGRSPEEHVETQHALRALVKIAQGEPMEALTAVEKRAVLAKSPDGLPRVEVIKGVPVITDATLDRIRQIAPITAQIMPQSEEAQRQAIVHPEEQKPTAEVEPTAPEAQPTFTVELQTPKGETTTTEVQAADEKEAHAIAAQQAPTGTLVRDVTKTYEPPRGPAYVPPEQFADHIVAQAASEAGLELKPEEETAIRNLATIAGPAYERWSKAFDTVNATLQSRGTAGAAFTPAQRALVISLPDLARHAKLYDDPESGNALVLHEAAHAVTTASKADVVGLYKSAPDALKSAMKEVYRVPGSTDYNYAHELWAYVLAGKVELAAGRQIVLDGKFLPEQADPAFVAKYRSAFAEVLKFARNIEGYLREQKVEEPIIKQWKEMDTLFTSKIKEVDAARKTGVLPKREGPPKAEAIGAEPTARGPPARTEEAVEPAGGGPAAIDLEPAPRTSEEARLSPTQREAAARAPEPVAGAELGEQVSTTQPTGEGLGPERSTDIATSRETREQVSSNLGIPTEAVGNQSQVTQGGRTLNVAYVAQEAAQSQTSHDAQGRVNPDYDQSLQPRDRSLGVYQKQSLNIARNLDFAKSAFFPNTQIPATTPDMGAPIMTPEGHTLVGNGREIGIKLAAQMNTPLAANYKSDFVKHATEFGIDPNAVRSMKHPILKRVILDQVPKEELVRFSQESNEPVAMGTNAIEVARRDASRLTDEHLSLLNPNYDLSSAKNAPFMRAYLRDVVRGTLGPNEANLTSVELSNRVRSAIFTHAYGVDEAGRAAIERLAGEADPSGKTITNGLLTVAPIIARMRSDIATGDLRKGTDIAPAVVRAAQDIATTLVNRPTAQPAKQALDALLSQRELFSEDPMSRAVLEFLVRNRNKRTAIEEGLSNYVEAIYALGSPKQVELFGEGGRVTPLEVFQRVTTPEAIARKEGQLQLAAQQLNFSLQGEIDPRLQRTFGNRFDFDAMGLPKMPETLPSGHPLLTSTDRLTQVTVPEDSKLVELGIMPSGVHDRAELHIAITRYFLQGGTLQGRGPMPEPQMVSEFLMMGGGGGAGKTTSLAAMRKDTGEPPGGSVTVNSDDIRELIPEYAQVKATGDGRAAFVTHEEATKIAYRLLELAQKKRVNIILDGTLKTAKNALRSADEAIKQGYEVRMLGVTIDPYEAAVRASLRASQKGRWVPHNLLFSAHKGFNSNIRDYIRKLGPNNVMVFDNTGAKAVQIPVDQIMRGEYKEVDARSQINPEAKTRYELFGAVSEMGRAAVTGRVPAEGEAGRPVRRPGSITSIGEALAELPEGKEVTLSARTPDGAPLQIKMDAKKAERLLTKRETAFKALSDCLGRAA